MLLIVLTIISLVSKSQETSKCLLSPKGNLDSECAACLPQYYNKIHDRLASSPNQTFDSSLNCDLRVIPNASRKILVGGESLTNCTKCQTEFSLIYNNLDEALRNESRLANKFSNLEINIYLEKTLNTNIYHLPANNIWPTEQLFRRRIVNLNISPVFCSEFSYIINCYSEGQKGLINLKEKTYQIYVSGSLRLKNLDIDAADINYTNKNDSCFLLNTCCNETSCIPDRLAISIDRVERKYSLFNIEILGSGVELGADVSVPQLYFENCTVRNFYLYSANTGILGVVRVLASSPFKLAIINSTFQKFLFLNGLLSIILPTEESIQKDWFYCGLSLDFIKNNSENASSNILVGNSSFKYYNPSLVSNDGVAEEVHLFNIINLGVNSSVTITKNIFQEINFQNKGQYIFNIISGKTSRVVFQENQFIGCGMGILTAAELQSSISFSDASIREGNFISGAPLISLKNLVTNISRIFIENLRTDNKSTVMFFSGVIDSILDQISILNTSNFSIEFQNGSIKLMNSLFSGIDFSKEFISYKFSNATIINCSLNYIKDNTFLNSGLINFENSSSIVLTKIDFQNLMTFYIFHLNKVLNFFIEFATVIDSVMVANFFSPSSSFSLSCINDTLVKNSTFGVIFELILGSPFSDRTIKIFDTSFRDIILKAFDYSISFSGFNIKIKNVLFYNTVKVTEKIPTSSIFFFRTSNSEVDNCTFSNVGFNYYVNDSAKVTNYCLFLLLEGTRYSFNRCVMIIDRNIHLYGGFIFSGYVKEMFVITSCVFKMNLNKKPKNNSQGINIYHSPIINIQNNIFVNLEYNLSDERSVLYFSGENNQDPIKNNKLFIFKNNIIINFTSIQFSMTVVNYFSVNIENLLIKNCSAKTKSTGLALISCFQVLMNVGIFYQSNGPIGGAIYLLNILNITILSGRIFNFKGNYSGLIAKNVNSLILKYMLVFELSAYNDSGVISISKTVLNLSDSILVNCSSKSDGGTIRIMDDSSAYLFNITSLKSHAMYGGFMVVSLAINLSLVNCTIASSYSEINGGALYVVGTQNLMIKGLNLINCTALTNGIIFLASFEFNINLNFSEISCLSNVASSGSCLYYASPNRLYIKGLRADNCSGVIFYFNWADILPVTIIDMRVENLRTSTNIIFIIGFSIEITNLSILRINTTENIFRLKFSKLILVSASIKKIGYLPSAKRKMIFSAEESIISINSLNFSSSIDIGLISCLKSRLDLNQIRIEYMAYRDNPLIFSSFSSISIKNSSFFKNNATCIKSERSNISVYDSLFAETYDANGHANILDMDNLPNENYLNFSNLVVFNENVSGLAVNVNFAQSIYIVSCKFEGGKNPDHTNQGLNISNAMEVIVDNSSFLRLSSQYKGPAIQIISESSLKYGKTILIKNSFFTSCYSEEVAGAIYILNFGNLLISGNLFLKNQVGRKLNATGVNVKRWVGGCGIILCSNNSYNSVQNNGVCTVSILENNFMSNNAYSHSSVFYSNIFLNFKRAGSTDSNTFYNNTDSIGFSHPISFMPLHFKLTYLEKVFFLKENQSIPVMLDDINSGKPTQFYICIMDSNGNQIIYDNETEAQINITELEKYGKKQIPHAPVKAEQGVINISNLIIIAYPNTTVSVPLQLKNLDKTFLNIDSNRISFNLTFTMRTCIIGETIETSDLSCKPCEEGKYSIDDPMKVNNGSLTISMKKCDICQAEAYCPGTYLSYPRKGYWKYKFGGNIYFLECPITEACEEYKGNKKNDSLDNCANGHVGNFCFECQEEFGKLSSFFQCSNCDEIHSGAVLRFLIASFTLLTCALVGSYVYSLEPDKKKKKDYLFVYITIGFNFTQTVSLFTFVRVKWVFPSFRKTFNLGTESVSLATEDVLLNDCLLKSWSIPHIEVYAYRVSISVFFPLILFIFTSLFWLIFNYIINYLLKKRIKFPEKGKEMLIKRLLGSLIISIFLFHSLMMKLSLSILNCIHILKEDSNSPFVLSLYPNIDCWNPVHNKTVYFFAIPSVLIWGFIFPIFLFFALWKRKKHRKSKTFSQNQLKINESPHSNQSEENSVFSPARKQRFSQRLSFNRAIKEIGSITIGPKPAPVGYFSLVVYSNIWKFFYFGYKPEYSFWESLNFLKKLIISLLINLSQSVGNEIIYINLLLILFLFLLFQLRCHPFANEDLNDLENFSLITIILIFFCIALLSLSFRDSILFFIALAAIFLYIIFLAVNIYYFFRTLMNTEAIVKLRNNTRKKIQTLLKKFID